MSFFKKPTVEKFSAANTRTYILPFAIWNEDYKPNDNAFITTSMKKNNLFEFSFEELKEFILDGNSFKVGTPFYIKSNFDEFDWDVQPIQAKKDVYSRDDVYSWKAGSKSFYENTLLALDIDDDVTIQQAIDICKNHLIDIGLLYPTFTHSINKDKFRILIQLPFFIKDSITYDIFYKTFIKIFSSDVSTCDPMRIFHGTKYDAIVYNDVIAKQSSFEKILNDSNIKYKISNNILSITATTNNNDNDNNDVNVNYNATKIINDTEIESANEDFNNFMNLKPLNTDSRYSFCVSMGRIYLQYGWNKEEFIKKANFQSTSNRDYNDIWTSTIEPKTYAGAFYQELNASLKKNKRNNLINKTIDNNKKISKSNIEDNYYINKYRDFNYKDYKIRKYLKTNSSNLIENIFNMKNDNTLLVSNTGTGKSYAVMDLLQKLVTKTKKYLIFTLPNVTNIQQLLLDFPNKDTQGLYDKNIFNPDKRIILTTWDSLNKLPNDLMVLLKVDDEKHLQVKDANFRKSIDNINKIESRCDYCIDITATPAGLILEEYDFIANVISSKKEPSININIINTNNDLNYMINNINKKTKNFIVYQKIELLKSLKSHIDKSVLINAKNKNICLEANKFINSINQFGLIPKDISNVLCTNLFATGVNINNSYKSVDIWIGHITSPADMKQIIARFRKVLHVNVNILYKPNDDKIIDNHRNLFFSNWNKEKSNIDSINKLKTSKSISNLENLNINKIKCDTYKDVYETKTSMDNLKLMLAEYYDIKSINIITKEIDKKFSTTMLKSELRGFINNLNKVPSKLDIQKSTLSEEIKEYFNKYKRITIDSILDFLKPNSYEKIERYFILNKVCKSDLINTNYKYEEFKDEFDLSKNINEFLKFIIEKDIEFDQNSILFTIMIKNKKILFEDLYNDYLYFLSCKHKIDYKMIKTISEFYIYKSQSFWMSLKTNKDYKYFLTIKRLPAIIKKSITDKFIEKRINRLSKYYEEMIKDNKL